jgi:hypothetical protein
MECLSLARIYSWEGENIGNGYGIKWSAIKSTFGEHIKNLKNIMKNLLRIENIWEQIGNMMRTQEYKKFHPHFKPFPLLAPSKGKNEPSWMYILLSH